LFGATNAVKSLSGDCALTSQGVYGTPAGAGVNGKNSPLGLNGNGRLPVCLQDSSDVRTSAGASVIWNSPVGPLRLDFAQAINKVIGDQTQFFRFGASTKF